MISLATSLIIIAVISEGQGIKHTFKTKYVKYYQNQERVTREQCKRA